MDEKSFLDYLKKVSPGTPLRTVIEDLKNGGLGALIVFNSDEVQNLIEGGFRVNCRFSAQRLFELCKMDGAIIVSQDLKRILYANVLLHPNISIHTSETGTRHKAGERTAKQANTFVIAVSERRQKTTLFMSNQRYILRNSDELLREVSTNLQVLEKHREIFNELISKLNILEASSLVSVSDVCKVLQRTQMIQKISESIKRYFAELGKEGNIMNLRYRELLKGVEKTETEVIRDYSTLSLKKTKTVLENLSFDGLLDIETIARIVLNKNLEDSVNTKGYRLLSRLTITEKQVARLVRKFKNLDSILDATPEEIEEVIKNRGDKIKEEISHIREQLLSGK